MSVPPQCLMLVVCDTVIEDTRSKNKSLINMFTGILAGKLPARHDKMCVYASFTGGRGRTPLTLRLCYDAEYEKDLLRLPSRDVDFGDNPLAVVDLVFEIRGFVFPKFGQYSFEIISDGVPLTARRLQVSQPPSGEQPPEVTGPPPAEPPSEP